MPHITKAKKLAQNLYFSLFLPAMQNIAQSGIKLKSLAKKRANLAQIQRQYTQWPSKPKATLLKPIA